MGGFADSTQKTGGSGGGSGGLIRLMAPELRFGANAWLLAKGGGGGDGTTITGNSGGGAGLILLGGALSSSTAVFLPAAISF